MPLEDSSSKKARQKNIKTALKHGALRAQIDS